MEPFFEMPLIELHCYSRYARVHAECIFKVTLSNSEWLYLLPLNFWSNAHDYMLILSETPSRHERCTCCSEVMISQGSIPKNNLPLRTHFYQLIAKAPVECIYGCFLFHTQFSRCSGSQWILRTPRGAKKHSLGTAWGVKLSRQQHAEHWGRESFHASAGLSSSHL